MNIKTVFLSFFVVAFFGLHILNAAGRPCQIYSFDDVPADIQADWDTQYVHIDSMISGWYTDGWPGEHYFPITINGQVRGKNYEEIEREVLDKQALILRTDEDPLDVVIRRTQALIRHLKEQDGESQFLDSLGNALETISQNTSGSRKEFYKDVCLIRRQAAFTNSLLDFDSLIFVEFSSKGGHMVDQYFPKNATKGTNGVAVLNDCFSPHPKVRSLIDGIVVSNGRLEGHTLSKESGAYLSPELSYDAKEIYFVFVRFR